MRGFFLKIKSIEGSGYVFSYFRYSSGGLEKELLDNCAERDHSKQLPIRRHSSSVGSLGAVRENSFCGKQLMELHYRPLIALPDRETAGSLRQLRSPDQFRLGAHFLSGLIKHV